MPRNQGNPLLNALGINVNLKHHHSIKYKFRDGSVEVGSIPALVGFGYGTSLSSMQKFYSPGMEEGNQRLF